MPETRNLRSTDLLRIKECITPAIIAHFKYNLFPFTSTDVDEVISMTFVKVAKSFHKYDEERSKKAWFQTMAKRCASDHMKREAKWRWNHQPMEMKTTDGEHYEVDYSDRECADSYNAERVLESKENVKVLKGAFDSVGDVAGRALWLQAAGYETKEIEDELGKAGGALRTAMSRGRSMLKKNEAVVSLADELLCISYSIGA